MKTTDWLRDQLPSANELLKNEKLRPLIESLSRNVVADGVRTFLEEMHSQWQHKIADLHVPPLGEIVDRLADRIRRDERPILRRVINATGTLFRPGADLLPLADAVAERIVDTTRDFIALPQEDFHQGNLDALALEEVRDALSSIIACEDVVVLHSQAAAEFLAVSAVGDGRVVLAGNRCAEHLQNFAQWKIGGPLVTLQVWPSISHQELCRQMEPGTACLWHASDGGGSESILLDLADLAAAAHSSGQTLVDCCPSASIVDLSPFGLSGGVALTKPLPTGVALRLFDGGHWVGGPACGVVCGRRDVVDRLKAHPFYAALSADTRTLLALAATLALYAGRTRPELVIPPLQLISTPIENLRTRAERLAKQCAAVNGIAHAEARPGESALEGADAAGGRLPTWVVTLTTEGGDATAFQRRLAAAPYPLLARRDEQQVVLDLRSVFARQDRRLVDAVSRHALREVDATTTVSLGGREDEARYDI